MPAMTKPKPIPSYEFCRGESPVGTHVCAEREFCKRFMPAGYKVNYKDFWLAEICPKFEAKGREEPLPEERNGLDW